MRRRKKREKRKRLLRRAAWPVLGIVMSPVLFVLIASSFFGWRFDVVPTKSMEPAFAVGGMVITRPVEPKDIMMGDPILFRESYLEAEARIVHRVIDITGIDSRLFFQTKGDANEYPDPDLVSSQNFIGKVVLYIPHVGKIAYLSRLYETPVVFMGKGLSIAVLFVVLVGFIMVSTEIVNIWEWTFRTASKRHQDRRKKREERLLKRRRFS